MPPLEATDSTVTVLKEVEVSSARKSKTVSSVTPYQKIDSKQLQNRGVTDISDAIRRLAGTNLRDYGGAGGMKTVSVRGLGATHTAVVYDGVALSDSQTGEIDLSRYSLDNVSSISLFSGENEDIFLPARASAASNSLFINSFNRPDFFVEGVRGKGQFTIGGYGYYNPFLRLEGRVRNVELS
ncbi:MAG: Plug domain-containing protein, partial [Muribaculaceae bacterium]|nr:Plug domain-containing protein [Muribaculaceae bacterium]